jgi:hypothetical protein
MECGFDSRPGYKALLTEKLAGLFHWEMLVGIKQLYTKKSKNYIHAVSAF